MIRDMGSWLKGGRTRIQAQVCLIQRLTFTDWISYAKIKFKVIKLSLQMRMISSTWLPDWSTVQHREAQLHQPVAMATQIKFQAIFLPDRLVSIFRWHPTQKTLAPHSPSSIKTKALFSQSYLRTNSPPCGNFLEAHSCHALFGNSWEMVSLWKTPSSKEAEET